MRYSGRGLGRMPDVPQSARYSCVSISQVRGIPLVGQVHIPAITTLQAVESVG